MNSHKLSYTLGITEFSDLTDEEFVDQYGSKFGAVEQVERRRLHESPE